MWMTAKERAEAAFIQPHQQRLACHVIREDRAAVLERLKEKGQLNHMPGCWVTSGEDCDCGLDETIAEILERTNETR